MSSRGAERAVALTMRGLAIAFAVVGILFISVPDGVIGTLDDVGDAIGSFSEGPASDQKLRLDFGFSYMTVITGQELAIATDPRSYCLLVLVLAAGKEGSALAAGVYL